MYFWPLNWWIGSFIALVCIFKTETMFIESADYWVSTVLSAVEGRSNLSQQSWQPQWWLARVANMHSSNILLFQTESENKKGKAYRLHELFNLSHGTSIQATAARAHFLYSTQLGGFLKMSFHWQTKVSICRFLWPHLFFFDLSTIIYFLICFVSLADGFGLLLPWPLLSEQSSLLIFYFVSQFAMSFIGKKV